jgi:hypothetical protein
MAFYMVLVSTFFCPNKGQTRRRRANEKLTSQHGPRPMLAGGATGYKPLIVQLKFSIDSSQFIAYYMHLKYFLYILYI